MPFSPGDTNNRNAIGPSAAPGNVTWVLTVHRCILLIPQSGPHEEIHFPAPGRGGRMSMLPDLGMGENTNVTQSVKHS